MIILGLSDMHGYHNEISDFIEIPRILREENIEMVIISGDISPMGNPHDVESFLKWFHSLEVKRKVFIFGNHERGMEYGEDWVRERIKEHYPSLTYLHHEHVTIDGIKIFGSPYTPYFRNWAYNVNRSDLEHYWNEIDPDTDIIVTHGPPFGIGDLVMNRRSLKFEITGCKHLLDTIMRIKPAVHQFGHIHEGHGIYHLQDSIDTKFVNASCLDATYNKYRTYAIYNVHGKIEEA